MRPGSHLGILSSHPEQNEQATAAFVRNGLDDGARVVMVGGPGDEHAARTLAAAGVSASDALRSGQLVIAPCRAPYGRRARSDVLGLLSGLRAAASAAETAGFAGLRIAADMAGVTSSLGSFDRLLSWEQMAAGIQSEIGVTSICVYDERAFSAAEARRLAVEHRCLIPDELARAPAAFSPTTEPFGLQVAGEVDIANRAVFLRAVRARLRACPVVTIDLEALDFVDVGSLAALYRLAAALPPGGRLVLARVPPHVRMLIDAGRLSDAPVELG